ncbi:MAG: signal transduction histidine kinase [Burkholderiaceae bacterium]
MNHDNHRDTNLPQSDTNAAMVGWMRLVLATTTLLTVVIDAGQTDNSRTVIYSVFIGYLAHSVALYVLSRCGQSFPRSKLAHWLDVCWYGLIVLFTGYNNSFYFLFFFFAILSASFRWGFEEGARVTIVSAALFAATAWLVDTSAEISIMLLRLTFLLTLGYMIAYWGESEVTQKRRLALLRDVSQLSNPRFGIDHTIGAILEKIRIFFNASSCVLLLPDEEMSTWSVRTATARVDDQFLTATHISAEAAITLTGFPDYTIALCNRFTRLFLPSSSLCLTCEKGDGRWYKRLGETGTRLAALLETSSLISAPVSIIRGGGRIHVTSRQTRFCKADALFLSDLAIQAFPVIKTIGLIDRLASDAALQERQSIAHDLHDTTIQPYIGLQFALNAIRRKAATDNLLVEDLDTLIGMTSQVIVELRSYAGSFKVGRESAEPMLMAAVRRQTDQARAFYGIDIQVSVQGPLTINDRLAAPVIQIFSEGLSNICRHSNAQQGAIRLFADSGVLRIEIENHCYGTMSAAFTPHSIVERAHALGGKSEVCRSPDRTTIRIEIPL